MAKEAERDEERDDENEAEERPRRSKKGFLLGGGMLALVAVAYAASLMAVPGSAKRPQLQGPFLADLSPEQLSVNLAGAGNKNFLAMTMRAEYVAFEPKYVTARITEPLFQAKLTDGLILVASRRTKEDLAGAVGKESLRDELLETVDPLLFPVVVGKARSALERDEESGLAPGRSMDRATMRGWWPDHVLSLDAPKKTVQLDEGEPVSFTGEESDLAVTNRDGESVYLDVTRVAPGFQGEVRVGVLGKLRSVYFGKFLVQ